jgi:hypothetical protein
MSNNSIMTELNKLLDMAHFSDISYLEYDEFVEQWDLHKNDIKSIWNKITVLPIFIESDVELYILETSESIVIVFRGSDTLCDLLAYGNTELHDYKNECFIHFGLYKYFLDIKYNLYEIIHKCILKKGTIMVTGHSSGGILAAITSVYLKECFDNIIVECYTFGSPKIGDKKFCDLFDSLIDNSVFVKNDLDIVPNLPLNPNYYHPQNILLIKNNTIYKKFISNCIRSSVKLCCCITEPVIDHKCSKYIEEVEKYILRL